MNIQESGSFDSIESRLAEMTNTRILVGIPQDNKIKIYREVIAEAWSDYCINKGDAKEISKKISERIIEMINDFNAKQGGKNNG